MIQQFEQGNLMPEKEWQNYIMQLEKESKPSNKEEVKKALIDAVKKRIPNKKFGIFFSGGVDSTTIAFLCKQNNADFTCYSVGLEGSPDLIEGKKAAEKLGLTLRQKKFTIKEAEEIFKKTAKLFDNPDPLNVGVGGVILAAVELAKEDKINTFFSGLGSEEIFAGYQRHAEAKDVHAECWRGLKEMWRRDFTRDYKIASALGIHALVPFLDEELIRKAMGISGDKKINGDHKKVILREISEELGVPKEFAWRKKKAAQYGSWFDKAMEKLAKKIRVNKVEYVKMLNKK
ncbi:hypothetical protein HYV79_05340 [Candidatus Woesearchaeota archaeon]|nr:hypothetical protein [Candidatus Woesearchaeota archaeon]